MSRKPRNLSQAIDAVNQTIEEMKAQYGKLDDHHLAFNDHTQISNAVFEATAKQLLACTQRYYAQICQMNRLIYMGATRGKPGISEKKQEVTTNVLTY